MTRKPFTPSGVGRAKRRLQGAKGWDRRLARALCATLAAIGVLPFLAVGVVRSSWVRGWTANVTQRILREKGISATYAPQVRVWPLAVELDDIRVRANDGSSAIECRRVLVRPRLLALLGGSLAIDQVDLDEPRIHAVIREGRLANVSLPKNGPSEGPARAPFRSL